MEVKSNNTIINKSKLIDQSKQNRIEGLDSLRGIFCLWVVVYRWIQKFSKVFLLFYI